MKYLSLTRERMKATPRKKALNARQKLSRLEDADDNGYCQCVSCRKYAHWKEGDGGHFIPKGHSSYWSLREENIHFQCRGCNSFGMRFGTASNQYTLWMVDKYGREFVDQMEIEKGWPIKYSKSEYLEMTADWNKQIKSHLKRIGE